MGRGNKVSEGAHLLDMVNSIATYGGSDSDLQAKRKPMVYSYGCAR